MTGARIDHQQLEGAVAAADLRVLLMVLVHASGDLGWLEPPFCPRRDIHLVADPAAGLAPEVQQRIRAGRLPSFSALTSSTSQEFYQGVHAGSGYGQARYLLYYLQEQGLLREYYRRFRAARRVDPSGYATLQQILGEADMSAFQSRWGRWVLDLKFEEPQ